MITCAKCKTQMHTIKIGVGVMVYAGGHPYKFHYADIKECPECKHKVISGFSNNPVWHRGDEEPHPPIEYTVKG